MSRLRSGAQNFASRSRKNAQGPRRAAHPQPSAPPSPHPGPPPLASPRPPAPPAAAIPPSALSPPSSATALARGSTSRFPSICSSSVVSPPRSPPVPEILLDSPSPRPESAHLAPESVLTLLRNPCSPWSGALRPLPCILSTANSMTSSCRAKTSIPDARREEMRTLSCRLKPATSLLFMLGMMTLAASSPSAAQGVCRGFDRRHTITRLGERNAFAPGGTQARTRAELREFFAANAEEIRGILASRGLGDEVAKALLDAVRQDTGITERTMRDGERLKWMAYRWHGKAKTIEDVCLDLPGAAPAFVIPLPMVTAAETARADCSIDVTTDLQPGGAP